MAREKRLAHYFHKFRESIQHGTKRNTLLGNDKEGIPKKYIDIMQDMYRDEIINVITCEEATQCLHRGSILSSSLFTLVIDACYLLITLYNL